MNDENLNKFMRLYNPSKFNHTYNTTDVDLYNGYTRSFVRSSIVELSLDVNSFNSLVDNAISGHEDSAVRARNQAVKIAYDHYITLLNLAR